MAAAGGRRVLSMGGKGTALSSASVFEVANGLAQIRTDSVASSCDSDSGSKLAQLKFAVPLFLNSEEARASLFVLLHKLLLSSSASSAASQLSQILANYAEESAPSPLICFLPGVAPDDLPVFDYSLAALDGISAVLDHRSSSLALVSDAVAALSCEALRADISVFNLADGSSAKDDIAVASDFKLFLNGSKLANGKLADLSVSKIPAVHGHFREVSRLLHSKTRVRLNSISRAGLSGTPDAIASMLFSFSTALRNLGVISYDRAKLVVDSLATASELQNIFQAKCPQPEELRDLCLSSYQALEEKIYVRLVHEIYILIVTVTHIVSWEAAVAIFALEGDDLMGDIQKQGPPKEGIPIADKSKKRKKVLGKGTTSLLQFIKDDFCKAETEPKATSTALLLETLVLLFNPQGASFWNILMRIREIVESNESRRLPKLPKGTRDFGKEQMVIREKAFAIISDVFKRHGATALDTPVFELRETLMGKYGEDAKLIYDLSDQGGELCSLRYDLTVPFARYVAMNGLTSFKRYQIAKVYRRDNPSKGRYREFYQCDFDIAGHFEKMGPDFEVIKILTELLDELDIGEYEVKLNHRKLLDGMLAICGVPLEKFRTICSSIDKLDKHSFEHIKREMVDDKGLTAETADQIGMYVKERGSPMELLLKLKQDGCKFLENDDAVCALNELEILFEALQKSKCINKVVFDLSLARGLDYYTGMIFEAVFKGGVQVGSIAAGGRYDNLIGMFGSKQVPAVGISLGIERVFAIMEQLQKDRNQELRATETQVLVSIIGDDLSVGAELVSELWHAKVKAEYLVNKRVMKHIGHAKESKIPWMVIAGDRELDKGVIKLKDVNNAIEYDDIPRDRFVEEICRRLQSTTL